MYYYAVGNELNLGKWNAFVDFMYSKEEIDRKGIITGIVGRPGGHNAFDTGYLSVVAKCNYRFLPKWNAFVKGMYETASVTKASEGIEKGNYRTSWGYLAGIEFYPMETNLHFFVTYVGRSYDFTSRPRCWDRRIIVLTVFLRIYLADACILILKQETGLTIKKYPIASYNSYRVFLYVRSF